MFDRQIISSILKIIFTEREKQAIGVVASALILYLIILSLLLPRPGPSIFDYSLFLPGAEPIVFQLVFGIPILLFGLRDRYSRILGVLLLLFSLAVAVRTLLDPACHDLYTTGKTLVATNIIFAYSAFTIINLLTDRIVFFRKAFPLIIYGVFLVYGVISIVTLIDDPTQCYRLHTLMYHANHLGNVLAFAVIFCFSIAASVKGQNSILLWLPIPLLIYALVHTMSRGAWLGCLVGLIASVIFLGKRFARKAIFARTVFLILIISVSLLSVSRNQLAKRFASDSPDIKFSVGNRIILWRYTARIIHNNWLSGIGIASFGWTLQNDNTIQFRNSGTFNSAMNNYINLAVEAGIPVFILYLTCLFYACLRANYCVAGYGLYFGIRVGLLCGIYSMLIFALTTYTLGRVYATVLVWGSFGYLLSSNDAVLLSHRS